MRARRLFFCLLILAATTASSPAEEPEFGQPDLDFFERRVRPILVKHCYQCHSAKADKLQGGLRLDGRQNLLKGGDLGPAVTPGRVEESLLIEAVRQKGELRMPPEGKLSPAEIDVLQRWVKRGAAMPQGAAATTRKIDLDEGRRFWSFQPLRKTAPPVADDWTRTRVDAFLLDAMRTQKLAPAGEASRIALIRRVTFDLTGAPPTPAAVDAFVANPSPDAYEQLVDRLLASPRYGERWGRHWLDYVRYSDSTATWLKSVGAAYLYRDWVINALNEDIAYDQFVIRQFATDSLEHTGPEDSAALGLLGLSPTYWKEPKLDHNVIKTIVASEWEERIDMIGRTFLGLTVACARCHDHKFDPITMKDYYALAGVLASSSLADVPIIPKPLADAVDEARKRVAEHEARIKKLKGMKPPPKDLDEQVTKLRAQIDKAKTTPHYDTPSANAVADKSLFVEPDGAQRTKLVYKLKPRNVALQIRGNPARSGDIVPRRFLSLFNRDLKPFQHGSGRRELAESIVRDSQGLAARVIVNRVWAHHFGRGLVTTPSNFGRQGARPSHPGLLDDLSARFVEGGWSIKWLHREILLSAAYRQSSVVDAKRRALDPDNRWLSRMTRRRLDFESWRDSLLWASDELASSMGGAALPLDDAQNRRRTIYGAVQRREVHAMLRLHDFPEPTAHSPHRQQTTTPLQQLFALNSPFLRRRAEALRDSLSRQAETDGERIDAAYRRLFQRAASDEERRAAIDFLQLATERLPREDAWTLYAHALLTSNEFLFVD